MMSSEARGLIIEALFAGLGGVIMLIAADGEIEDWANCKLHNKFLSVLGTGMICASLLVIFVGLAGGYRP